MAAFGRTATIQLDAPSDCKQTSRFCLLCHFQRIVDFDAKVSHRAFQLGMSEKELNCPKVRKRPANALLTISIPAPSDEAVALRSGYWATSATA